MLQFLVKPNVFNSSFSDIHNSIHFARSSSSGDELLRHFGHLDFADVDPAARGAVIILVIENSIVFSIIITFPDRRFKVQSTNVLLTAVYLNLVTMTNG